MVTTLVTARASLARQTAPHKANAAEQLFQRLVDGDRTAIPALEQIFAKGNAGESSKDDILSLGDTFHAGIAGLLVSRGVKDPQYFNFILELARQAIDAGVPSPVAFGKDGLFVPHFTPPDFVAWCNDHNLELSQAARDAWYHLPSKVIPLASSGDPRGFPQLAKGLKSPNYMVVTVSAQGLARINDARAIPAIIEVCEKAPVEVLGAIAQYLIYFDDPRAQAAADRFITDKKFLETFRNEVKQNGLKGIFGW